MTRHEARSLDLRAVDDLLRDRQPRLLADQRGLDRHVRPGHDDPVGELGFFPPYSWWPLWCGSSLGVIVYGTALGAWWLVTIGMGLGVLALSGLVFEYYKGEHAH